VAASRHQPLCRTASLTSSRVKTQAKEKTMVEQPTTSREKIDVRGGHLVEKVK
jgi:hypothetical protein